MLYQICYIKYVIKYDSMITKGFLGIVSTDLVKVAITFKVCRLRFVDNTLQKVTLIT